MIDDQNADMLQVECKILKQMVAHCVKAERCVWDVENKLKKAGLNDKAVIRSIQFLVENDYINEARFARCLTNDKLRFNHWGRKMIIRELRRRKVPEVCIQEAIGQIDENESAEILSKLLRERYKGLKRLKKLEKNTIAAQLIHYALSRGYTLREANAALALIGVKGDDYDSRFSYDED